MRKLRLLLPVFCLLALLAPVPAHAATDVLIGPCAEVPDAVACQDRDQAPGKNSLYGSNGVITKVTQLVAILVGISAVIVVILAGMQYILSSGDPAKINSAKNSILYAIIGLVVAVLAQSIVVFILRKL